MVEIGGVLYNGETSLWIEQSGPFSTPAAIINMQLIFPGTHNF